MATLLYSAFMSLDGYISGPGGDMSWLAEHLDGADPGTAERLLAGTGAILAGARTHRGDDPNRGTDAEGAFGGQYDGPVVVLTHHPAEVPEPGVTYAGDLATAVDLARRAAGDRYVNVLGADVARQCLEAGQLDEILTFVAPVLLGDGVRLFSRPGGPPVRLRQLPGTDQHWYAVER